MRIPILTLGTVPDAIAEYRLEPVEITSDDIRVPIYDHACQVLPYSLAHDAGLAMMHVETFFEKNRGHMG